MLNHDLCGAEGEQAWLKHGAGPSLTKRTGHPKEQVKLCLSLIHNPKKQRFFINHLVTNLSSSGNKNRPKQIWGYLFFISFSINIYEFHYRKILILIRFSDLHRNTPDSIKGDMKCKI